MESFVLFYSSVFQPSIWLDNFAFLVDLIPGLYVCPETLKLYCPILKIYIDYE